MTAAHWLVYCSDGLRRHDSPFESRGEALHWQTWGHYPCPFQPHTLRKISDSPDSPPVAGEVSPVFGRSAQGEERTRGADPREASQRGVSQAPGELVRDKAGGGDTAPLGVAPPTEPGLPFSSSPVDPPMESRIAPGETRGALDLSGRRSVSGDLFPVLPGEVEDGKNGVGSEPIGRSCSSGSESTPLLDLIPRLRAVGWSPEVGAGNPFGEVRGHPFRKGTSR